MSGYTTCMCAVFCVCLVALDCACYDAKTRKRRAIWSKYAIVRRLSKDPTDLSAWEGSAPSPTHNMQLDDVRWGSVVKPIPDHGNHSSTPFRGGVASPYPAQLDTLRVSGPAAGIPFWAAEAEAEAAAIDGPIDPIDREYTAESPSPEPSGIAVPRLHPSRRPKR
mmetsp:Transcript_24422/g.73106  ORF Transcript_24422/g.73106 Transcript_24422/m.73106 type:complete len:165 (+) Transcript_24422:16-510(+)